VRVIGALLLVLLALVVSAFAIDRSSDSSGAQAVVASTADLEAARSAAAQPAAPHVVYAGPRGRLHGPVVLRARVRSAPSRVVAVTFLLDGTPLGTDTVAPYGLDVDASHLAHGRHRISVQAVDRLGARAATRPVVVHTGGSTPGGLTASPTRGLAAALAALARGNVTVQLEPGRYAVRHVQLGSGARLRGAGARTVLTATAPVGSLVSVHGAGVRIADLSIDGARRADRAIGVANGSRDVRMQRLAIRGIRAHGVEMWGQHDQVSLQDSTIAGGGAAGAGVFDLGSDRSRDVGVIGTRIAGFRGYGIDFVQQPYCRRAAALHNVALDNRIADINDPKADTGTHEGGIWSGGVAAAIIGNQIRRTGIDGIETVGSSTGTSIVDNDVAQTPVGIYVEHETHRSLVARNRITDVATGINVEWRHDGGGSDTNTYAANRITNPREAGVFIDVSGDRNRILGNIVTGGEGPAVVLQGASENVVVGNRGCARGDQPVVREQSARFDDGRPAHSRRNRLADNLAASRCGT
jgi:hypothetical protein